MRQLMCKFTVLAALLLCIGCSTQPTTHRTVAGRVLHYGLWQPIGPSHIERTPTTLTGLSSVVAGERLIEQTRRVPARLGTVFGMAFEIDGVSEAGLVTLDKVVKHPPTKNAKGAIETQYTVQISAPAKYGTINWYTGYLLNHTFELTPGEWTIEIWYHRQRVASQSFTLYSVSQ